MSIPLLNDILIILALSIAVLIVCHKLRIPTIVGFLVTGILAGPHGFRLINAVDEVEVLAEIGIALLLFTIGIEFSLAGLLRIAKSVLLGGGTQVILTMTLTVLTALSFGEPADVALFVGFVVALSSTAIVLRTLQERSEIDSPHGRTSLAILIFQDIAIVPMILVVPMLAGMEGDFRQSVPILLTKAGGVVLLVIGGARWFVPWLLFHIVRLRSRELFMISVVAICLAVAALTAALGLSLALGAFLAGLIISDSEYSHQALGSVQPFRDLFSSFFFVAVGMLLNLEFFAGHLGLILGLTLLTMVGKCVIATVTTMVIGFSVRTAVLTGIALSQIGEFGFILLKTGQDHAMLSEGLYQCILAVSIITMAVTPFIMMAASAVADWSTKLPLPVRLREGIQAAETDKEMTDHAALDDHLIIIGFGLNGRNLANAAKMGGIPYVIIELNAETVRAERARGETIFFGDASHEAVLSHAGLKAARVVVVTIPDPAATRKITVGARQANDNVYIIARTRFVREVGPLQALGADEVIPEEFETSIEIFVRVLRKYWIPVDIIELFAADVRADSYRVFRGTAPNLSDTQELPFTGFEIATFRVGNQSSADGGSIAELDIKNKYGLTLLAVNRGDHLIAGPDPGLTLEIGDVVVVAGRRSEIIDAAVVFQPPRIQIADQ